MLDANIVGNGCFDPTVRSRYLADSRMHEYLEHCTCEGRSRVDDGPPRTIKAATDKHRAGAAPDRVSRISNAKQLHAGSP
jgi:hypothetical protein